ncbi:MAG: citramalate synthase [Magnetococcales bacterium]|nr:citramalate synthase [Magnetococcales bacterium]NGZ26498.1 citramalate synthase [Magnetococcales bacterium]
MVHPKEGRITLYDTTLRDGSQAEDVLFTVEDKLRILQRLDEFGVDFIEGGWPGANPKDELFFQQAKSVPLRHSRLTAFGSTRKPKSKVENDPVLNGLLRAETSVVTIFGKSWDLHVSRALGITLEENLHIIDDSIRFLKQRVDTVFFDAEHFFDGYKAAPEYALKVLETARDAGADCLVLCDTNGGSLVHEIAQITQTAQALGAPLGIHCHNDADLAVANSLSALTSGAMHVQGTINGIGERCGNANLVSIIANLCLKMGCNTNITPEQLARLTPLSRFVDEMINRSPRKNQPYVGQSAFAHKGGIHVSAVLKDAATYEHVVPELVGNRQRVLVSEQSGKSNLIYKFREMGIEFNGTVEEDGKLAGLLQKIKELEKEGYQFDGAEGSFELLARRALGKMPEYFAPRGFRVIDERRFRETSAEGCPGLLRVRDSEGTVKLLVAGVVEHLVSEGTGPVDALYNALHKVLQRYYPSLASNRMMLMDYKVRILNKGGTDAKVRVLVGWRDHSRSWSTVGVSDHIIEASYDAMLDAITYKLFKDGIAPLGGVAPTFGVIPADFVKECV